MANRAYLLNTRTLSNDCFALSSAQATGEVQCVEIAEAAYRIPVPWMCCFRPEDLRRFAPRRIDVYGDEISGGGDAIAFERMVPCTTVASARSTLEAAWPLFEAIARGCHEDPEESAREHWSDALAALAKLPFPFLTIVVHEVIEDDSEHTAFLDALRGDLAAIPHLIKLSRSDEDTEVALAAGIWRDFDAAGRVAELAAEQEDSAAWHKAWRRLARGRSRDDEEAFQDCRRALDHYARNGLSPEEIRNLSGWVPFKVPPNAKPPPLEWEWKLASELTSYAEFLVGEVETDQVRGRAFNVERAQNAFAAQFTAQMIALHRLGLCQARQCSSQNIRVPSEAILYTALGFVAGCGEPALRSARLLCASRRRVDFQSDIIHPAERFVLLVFSAHLNEAMPPIGVRKEAPALNALLEGGFWRNADPDSLAPLCLAACREYTHIAPDGPFRGVPITIWLIFKLRELQGLANPGVDHPLLNALTGSFPAQVPFSMAADGLVARVRERMASQGYDEKAINDLVINELSMPFASGPSPESGTRPTPDKPWWKFW